MFNTQHTDNTHAPSRTPELRGEVDRGPHCASHVRNPRAPELVLVPRHSKVTDPNPPVCREQNVVGLEVSIDDVLLV